MPALKWQAGEVMDFLHTEFPQAFANGRSCAIKELEPGRIVVAFDVGHDQLRPGGIISGPALVGLVDLSIYFLLLAHHQADARMSVTTNLQISFLRKADPGELHCAAELIKHGRTLSVADARVLAPESGRLIAHAQATYYMPGSE